ncbi:hypothetical protein SAMN05660662_1144 [Blastococcus aurantiacus]|uniref:Uncharacterized protein n=1 Tax=Blastococcus aurantiacus TaxID=1550231 RepID=A0A1G7IVB4_9ACTN|nr:hypothetical protein [Blastococcus aurantiacus]SDF16526.1 hypothetical protein SAMN05660662_1144 [Blastococcus aurantiacus]
MRRRTAVIGALLLAAATGCADAAEDEDEGDSAGACAVPIVMATPEEVRPGDEVTVPVTGPWECRDSGGPAVVDEERPVLDILVEFHQGDVLEPARDVRGTGTTYDGSVTVVVPEDAVPGPAGVRVGDVVHGWFTVVA